LVYCALLDIAAGVGSHVRVTAVAGDSVPSGGGSPIAGRRHFELPQPVWTGDDVERLARDEPAGTTGEDLDIAVGGEYGDHGSVDGPDCRVREGAIGRNRNGTHRLLGGTQLAGELPGDARFDGQGYQAIAGLGVQPLRVGVVDLQRRRVAGRPVDFSRFDLFGAVARRRVGPGPDLGRIARTRGVGRIRRDDDCGAAGRKRRAESRLPPADAEVLDRPARGDVDLDVAGYGDLTDPIL